MNGFLRLGVFGILAVGLSACFVIPQDAVDAVKDQIPQPENTLRIDAQADGSGKTHMIVCVSDPVVCVNADGPFAVTIAGGGEVNLPFLVDYTESDGKQIGRFQGDLTGDAAESEIAVVRAGDPDTKSVVTLPEASTITSPMEGEAISAASGPIKLTWDSKGLADSMEWSAAVSCGGAMPVDINATKIEDTGTAEVDPAKLNLKAGETCEVTLRLSRWRDGTIEKAFEGKGLITAKQTRSVKVTVSP